MIALAFLLAAAQDHQLTPTDVLENAGDFYATVRPRISFGSASLNDASFDLDVDLQTFDALLEAGIGLGNGFEVELSIPYAFSENTDGDGDFGPLPFETQEEDSGFGDLLIVPQYRLVKQSATEPQWVVGAILVVPTGNDKRGDAELEIAGVTIVEGEDGGVGQGVWKYGLQTGVAMKLGDTVEGYAVLTYAFGGSRERNSVDEERADIGTLTVGLEFQLAARTALDLRAGLNFVGEDITEESGAEKTEEDHLQYGLQAQLYANLGPGWTLVVGASALLVQDHTADEEDDTDIEDGMLYSFSVGVHYFFGSGRP